VNEAYIEAGMTNYKKTARFGNLEHAKKFMSNMWILRNEEGAIIACIHAKVQDSIVEIGPIAVQKQHQVSLFKKPRTS
jgi:hypothetical protein